MNTEPQDQLDAYQAGAAELPATIADYLARTGAGAQAVADLAVAEVRFSIAALMRSILLIAMASLIGLFALVASIAALFVNLLAWMPLAAAAALTALVLIVTTYLLYARAAVWRDRMGLTQTRAVIRDALEQLLPQTRADQPASAPTSNPGATP